RPSSLEYDSLTSLACMPEPLLCNQLATSVPPVRRRTEGTSMGLTDQSLPEAADRGSVQPVAVRSANRSVVFGPSCSIQLRSRPRSDVVSCGSPLLEPAGEGIPTMDGCQAGAR